jgi:hypothetical protein
MNIIISLVVFVASVFLLAVSLRYGLSGAARMDTYFSQKNNSDYEGFPWFYRIPFNVGVIPEFFYAIVIGFDNYFKHNWWALKTSSFISVLVFIAGLKSRSAVAAYFSFSFLKEAGILGFFNSGNFVMFMNIVVLLYVALFVMICIESFKMHGKYAPIRIAFYSMLCLMMANFTIITLSIIIFISVVYLVFKILAFFFTSRRRRRRYYDDDEEETTGSILSKGMQEFKVDLDEWEEKEKDKPKTVFNAKSKSKPKSVKRPKITRRRKPKSVVVDDEIPRLHPD